MSVYILYTCVPRPIMRIMMRSRISFSYTKPTTMVGNRMWKANEKKKGPIVAPMSSVRNDATLGISLTPSIAAEYDPLAAEPPRRTLRKASSTTRKGLASRRM